MRIIKRVLLSAAILILAVAVLAVYLLRGGFHRFEARPYPIPPSAFVNWGDVLAHPREISDHTGGVPALGPQTEFIFGKAEAGVLARAAVANHFSGKSKFLSIDFSSAPTMAPLGPCVDLFGDGSFWAIDDIAYLVNGPQPILLTGDASHFRWAFENGVAPRGWDKAGTAHGYVSLERLRAFARAYPNVKLVYGHEIGAL